MTLDKKRIAAVRALVESAEVPSRDLDAEIARATGLLKPFMEPNGPHGSLCGYEYKGQRHSFYAPWWAYHADHQWPPTAHVIARTIHQLPRFTESIDAAVGLLQELLPGWWWTCGYCRLTNDGSVWIGPQAALGPDPHAGADMETLLQFDDGFHGDRVGGTVPLALVGAALQALEALADLKEHKT